MSEEKLRDPQNPGESGSECCEKERTSSTEQTAEAADANVCCTYGANGDSVEAGKVENESCCSEDTAQGGGDGTEEQMTLPEMQQRIKEQEDALAKLEVEKKELTDRLLRLQADFDNFRRRTRAEAATLADAANAKVFVELLPVVDNLERAVAAEGADKSFRDGVALVLRQFLSTLEKMGVVPISAVGEEFDPTRHEAVMRVEATEEFPSGTVVEVLQKGYLFKDKVLRPAMVKVAG